MRDMDAAEVREFLAAGTRTGKVATVSRKGRPHVAPLWFVVDGDDLVFMTSASSAKGRHLRANPQACLVVDEEMFPFAFAMVSGPVSIVEEAPDRLAWSTRIAARYVPGDRVAEFGARNDAPGELLVRLHVQKVIAQADLAG
jgi:PPOX class probable F420-dependent enzyme